VRRLRGLHAVTSRTSAATSSCGRSQIAGVSVSICPAAAIAASPRARIGVAGEREIRLQIAAVGGGHPIQRPAEDSSQRVQPRQRKTGQRFEDNPGEAAQSFGILAAFLTVEEAQAMSDFLFTSESVSEGHPDKVADQISDAVLDAILKQDKTSRVAAETLVKDNLVVLAGEITTNARVNYDQVARQTIRRIGYTDPNIGFDAQTCTVLIAYGQQSPDIAQAWTRARASTSSRARRPGPDVRLCLRRDARA
jgi:hypothetical protein